MKLFAAGVALLVTMVLAGCGNTNNYYGSQDAPEVGADAGTANCARCTRQQQCTDCANGYRPMSAGFPVVPVAVPQATQIVTSYEEVYATEYTANGPVVKKQLVPIKSTVPVVAQPVLMNTPNGYSASYGVPVSAPQQLPVVIGTPPAQATVPSIQEPVAWFGPTAAPNYSTQTNWF